MDNAISKHIVEMIPDRATLQVGIGGVPNAVCAALHGHKDLGIHTELMMPSLAALIQSGAVTNKYKNLNRYKNVYTLAAGDEAFLRISKRQLEHGGPPRRLRERPERHRTE